MDMWIGILNMLVDMLDKLIVALISALIFKLIDNKAKLTERVNKRLKIKNPSHLFLLFIAQAAVIGVLMVVIRITVLNVSGNEMAAEMAASVAFGAGISFFIRVDSSLKG